jgi:hypothetical protein
MWNALYFSFGTGWATWMQETVLAGSKNEREYNPTQETTQLPWNGTELVVGSFWSCQIYGASHF